MKTPRRKNKEDIIYDSMFWPIMPIHMVRTPTATFVYAYIYIYTHIYNPVYLIEGYILYMYM